MSEEISIPVSEEIKAKCKECHDRIWKALEEVFGDNFSMESFLASQTVLIHILIDNLIAYDISKHVFLRLMETSYDDLKRILSERNSKEKPKV